MDFYNVTSLFVCSSSQVEVQPVCPLENISVALPLDNG